LINLGGPEVLVERDLPIPKPSRHEVRIKVKAVGFNPVDYKMRSGVFETEFPIVLGLDCSGVIDAIGEKYHEFSLGDEVCAFAFGPCSNGTYAQYLCLPTQFVVKKPKALSFFEAAAMPVAYLTAFQALIQGGALQQDRPLFIAGGSGGVGSAAIALAKAYSAGPIFTTAGSQESHDYLIEQFHLPSENILHYSGQSVEQMAKKLIEMNGGERFYLTFDCVGETMKELCFAVSDFGGHLATILSEDEQFPIPIWGRKSPVFNKSLSLHIIFLGAAAVKGDEKSWNVYKAQLKHLAHLFDKEGLIGPHIENLGSFSLETVRRAHQLLEESHNRGKLVMEMSDST